jgi:hypothetical protein
MTTDKVEIFVNIEPRRLTTILEIGGWFNGKWSVLERTHISQDRDNWIDITLPEAIDGYKDWKGCIYYEDGSVKENNETIGWKAFMRHKDMAQGQAGYELQVTVY